MYNDDYRNFEPFEEFDDFEDLNNDDGMVEFTPPHGCPMYRLFPFPGGGGTPPRPPFGPPGGPGGPGFGPGGPGFGPGGPQGGAPSGPPPKFTPSKAQAQSFGGPGVFAVDPGAIRPCRFRFVYIWLRNGNSFWAWLTFVGRNSASGYRWNGRRWVYFGIDLRRIDSFVCY
jgi:hypothetical protein